MRLNRKGALALAVLALVILASGAAEAKTTAGQVKDDATLEAFVLGAKAEIEAITDVNEGARLRERLRTEGDWKSGSMFLIIFLPTGEPFIHGNDQTAESKNLLGVEDDNGLKVVEELLAAAARGGGFVKYHDGEPKTAYAVAYTSGITGRGFVLVGGYSQDVSHVPLLIADLPKPAVTASQVVNRETLITFVEEAARVYREGVRSEGYRGLIGIRNAFRLEGGDWKSGSVYLWVVSGGGIILFHATEPFREGRPTDLTRTDINGVRFAEELIGGARREGRKFVQYYYDDPTIEGDEDTGSPKLGYAVSFPVPNSEQKAVIGSGIYLRDTGTIFLPVVLSAAGRYTSHFTSELALTNRGSDAAMLNYTYTPHQGGGGGTATDMLGPHQQKIQTNAIEYLRGLEVPIPETGKRIGTLRVDVSISSDVSAVVRTTTPTAVPEGRAGLAYPGVPENEGFHDEAVYLCGLRDNPGDRSNVAIQNMGSEGSITVRTTVFSGNPADPMGEMLEDMTLGPGEFHQFNAVLQAAGKADPMFGGYVRVERVEGMAPFYAYGVINDNANSDGSFVFPVSAASLEGAMGQTLPALVESGAFATELTLTNFSSQPKLGDVQRHPRKHRDAGQHGRLRSGADAPRPAAHHSPCAGLRPSEPGTQRAHGPDGAPDRQPGLGRPERGGDWSPGGGAGGRARPEQGAVRGLLHGGAAGAGIHRQRLGGRVAAERGEPQQPGPGQYRGDRSQPKRLRNRHLRRGDCHAGQDRHDGGRGQCHGPGQGVSPDQRHPGRTRPGDHAGLRPDPQGFGRQSLPGLRSSQRRRGSGSEDR